MTQDQARRLRIAMQTLIDAVKAAGDRGAPGGVMYAALTGAMTLDQFTACMSALVKGGFLRRSSDLYFFQKDLLS